MEPAEPHHYRPRKIGRGNFNTGDIGLESPISCRHRARRLKADNNSVLWDTRSNHFLHLFHETFLRASVEHDFRIGVANALNPNYDPAAHSKIACLESRHHTSLDSVLFAVLIRLANDSDFRLDFAPAMDLEIWRPNSG
jgi:hypothetical protein